MTGLVKTAIIEDVTQAAAWVNLWASLIPDRLHRLHQIQQTLICALLLACSSQRPGLRPQLKPSRSSQQAREPRDGRGQQQQYGLHKVQIHLRVRLCQSSRAEDQRN